MTATNHSEPNAHTTSPKNRNWKKVVYPIVFLLVAALTFMYLVRSKEQAPAKEVEERMWTVQAEQLVKGAHQPQIVLYGQVESPKLTVLTSSVTAYVSSVEAKEGTTVNQNTLLVALDPRDANLVLRQRDADLNSIEARIKAAQIKNTADKRALQIEKELYTITTRSVSRYQDLSKRNVGSQDQLDTARKAQQQQALAVNTREQSLQAYASEMAQLEAEREKITALRDSAALDVERTKITAPFTSRISDVSIATGDRVRSGEPLVTLYDPTHLQVRSQLPSRYLPLVRQGINTGEPLIATGQLDGRDLSLTLTRLATSVTSGNPGVEAILEFAQSDFHPEPGRTLSVRLSLPLIENIYAVSPQALYGTDRIYRIRDSRLEAVMVQRVGDLETTEGEPKVLLRSEALEPEDIVITTQLPNAIAGLKVNLAEQ